MRTQMASPFLALHTQAKYPPSGHFLLPQKRQLTVILRRCCLGLINDIKRDFIPISVLNKFTLIKLRSAACCWEANDDLRGRDQLCWQVDFVCAATPTRVTAAVILRAEAQPANDQWLGMNAKRFTLAQVQVVGQRSCCSGIENVICNLKVDPSVCAPAWKYPAELIISIPGE